MSAIGYASLAVIPSIRGIQKEITNKLEQPFKQSTERINKTLKDGLTDGVQQATKDVEVALSKQENAIKKVEKAEQGLTAAKSKNEQAIKSVKAAEIDLENTRSKSGQKVLKAEQDLERVRNDSKSTASQIANAEEKLNQARMADESSILKKEAALERARQKARDTSQLLDRAEENLKKSRTNSESAAENLTAAQVKLEKAQAQSTKGTKTATNFLAKFKSEARESEDAVGNLSRASEGIGNKLKEGFATLGKGAILGVGASVGHSLVQGVSNSISSGLDRLKSIEQSQQALLGLGHTAQEVSAISENALEAVKGTAYGLGDASSLASTMVASGIKPGKELTRILKLVSDTAAISGKDLNEIGSIWGKVAARGKLTTEELNQLTERRIAILPKLAEKMGMSVEEVQKKISEGGVSFDEFADVMEDTLGGSALKTANTVTGAFDNMKTAAGRLGAQLMEPAFKVAPTIFTAIGGGIDKFGEKLQPIIDDLMPRLQPLIDKVAKNAGPALEKAFSAAGDGILNVYDFIVDFVEKHGPKFVDIFEALGNAVSKASQKIVEAKNFYLEHKDVINSIAVAVGAAIVVYKTWHGAIAAWVAITKIAAAAQAAFNAVMSANPIMLAVMAIAALAAGLTYFFTQTETGRQAWATFTGFLSDAWNAVVESLSAGWDWIYLNVITPMMNAWSILCTTVSGLWNGLVQTWNTVWNAIIGFWNGVVQPVLDGIVSAFQTAFLIISTAVLAPFVIAWNFLSAAISAAWEGIIKPVLNGLGEGFLNLWNSYIKPTIDFIVGKWNELTSALSAVWNTIKTNVLDAFQVGMNVLKGVIDVALNFIRERWENFKNNLSIIWNWIDQNVFIHIRRGFDLLRGKAQEVLDAIVAKWNWFKGLLHQGWVFVDANVLQPFRNGFNVLKGHIQAAIDNMASKWNWMKDRFTAIYNTIKSAVLDALVSAINNVKSAFHKVVDAIGQKWNELKAKTAKPINFVIDAVYNNGIRSVWNKVADFIGAEDKKLSPVAKLAYASGGVLPGYTPGRDVYDFYSPQVGQLRLSGGEAIMRPEWVRAVGGVEAVNAMNKVAITKGVSGVRRQLGEGANAFASGGVFNFPGAVLKFAKGGDVNIENAIKRTKRVLRAEHGKPYQYGGTGNPSWDCSGLWSGITQELNNAGTLKNGRIFTTESPFANWGYTKGLTGRVTIGVHNGGGGMNSHMAGTIDGINMESGGNGVQIGGLAIGSGDSSLENKYTLSKFLGKYIPGANGGGDSSGWIRSMVEGAFDSILKPIMDRIPTPPGYWGQVPKGLANKAVDSFKEWVLSKIPVGGGSGGGSSVDGISPNVRRWEGLVRQTMAREGFNANDERQVNAFLKQIQSESGGDPAIAQQIVDVNGTGASAGLGLMQIIPSTFAAYRDPSLPNDRTNPEAAMVAALRYYRDRYGNDLTTTWGHGHGYATGGVLPRILNSLQTRLYDSGGVLNHGTAALNLSGKPEAILTNDQWKLMRGIGSDLQKAFAGNRSGGKTLNRQVGKNVGNGITHFLANIGDVFGKTEKAAQATENYNKVLKEVRDSNKAVKDAENKLNEARQSGDKDKIAEAEKALDEARKAAKDNAKKVADAEKELAKARGQAIVDFVEGVSAAMSKVFKAQEEFGKIVATLAQRVHETKEKISELSMQLANDRINMVASVHALRVAEFDLRRARIDGALSVIDAEAQLDEARRNAMLLGTTGVNDLAAAVNRFRETGVFNIEQITQAFTERTAEVRAAEANLYAIKAQTLIDEELAAKKMRIAQIDMVKNSLAAIQTQKLLALHTAKLQQQTAQLYGMDQYGATAAQRGLEGKSKRNQGIFGLLGGIAASIFGFATGNIAAGASGVMTGIQSIGNIITGSHQYKAYKEETKELESKLSQGDKALLTLGNVLGGVSAGVGAIAGTAGGLGVDAILAGTNIGSELASMVYGTVGEKLQIDMDKIDLEFAKQIAYLTQDYDAKMAELDMEKAVEEMKSDIKISELESVKELAEINKRIAESNSKAEIQKLGELAQIAQDRRDSMVSLLESVDGALQQGLKDAQKASLEAGEASKKAGNKPIVINLPENKTAYSAEEVELILNSINSAQDELEIRIRELEAENTVTGADYVNARRG